MVAADGAPLEGANVVTVPETERGVTDRFGTVTLRDIRPNVYEVFAELQGEEGKATVRVLANTLAETTIRIPISNPSEPAYEQYPILYYSVPNAFYQYVPGKQITFEARVSDRQTQADSLSVTWTSDLDGALYTGYADKDGLSTFTSALSGGEHLLTVTVADPDGNQISDTETLDVTGLPPVTLAEVVVTDLSVALSWSVSVGEADFGGYNIERSTGRCTGYGIEEWVTLAILENLTDTAYVDTTIVPLAERICYRIKSEVAGEELVSNVVTYEPKLAGFLGFRPGHMVAHPTEPFVYIVDDDREQVVKFDVDAMRAVDSAEVGGSPARLTIGDAGEGLELFVPSSNGNVFVLDLGSLERRAVFSTRNPAKSVAPFADGFILVVSEPEDYDESALHTYRRSDQSLVETLPSPVYVEAGQVRTIPGDRAAVYIGDSELYYYSFDLDGRLEQSVLEEFYGDVQVSEGVFEVSPTGEYLVTSADAYVFAADESLEFRGALDHAGTRVGSVAFSADGSQIYAGIAGSRRDDPLTERGLLITSYPSRLRAGRIRTRGHVLEVVRLADGRVVTLQSSSPLDT